MKVKLALRLLGFFEVLGAIWGIQPSDFSLVPKGRGHVAAGFGPMLGCGPLLVSEE
jgi:hypothetical protein